MNDRTIHNTLNFLQKTIVENFISLATTLKFHMCFYKHLSWSSFDVVHGTPTTTETTTHINMFQTTKQQQGKSRKAHITSHNVKNEFIMHEIEQTDIKIHMFLMNALYFLVHIKRKSFEKWYTTSKETSKLKEAPLGAFISKLTSKARDTEKDREDFKLWSLLFVVTQRRKKAVI